jgi:signal transduction histidine kinase
MKAALSLGGIMLLGSFLAFTLVDVGLSLASGAPGGSPLAGLPWMIGAKVIAASALLLLLLLMYIRLASRFSSGMHSVQGLFRDLSEGRAARDPDESVFVELVSLYETASRIASALEAASAGMKAERVAFDELVEALPLIVAIVDGKGRIARCNRKFLDLAGARQGSGALGLWDEILPAMPIDSIKASAGRPLSARVPAGETRTVLWWYLPAPSAGEGGLILAGQDLTEVRAMEDKLRNVDRMQSLGQLAGGIAHDFNNQICGIMGLAEVLLDKCRDDGSRRDIETIISAAKRSADLTAKLLAFSRAGAQIMERTDLNSLAREAAALLSSSAEGAGRVELRLEARKRTARGDPGQLRNAIFNLAANAREAMNDGGVVVIASVDEEFGRDNALGLLPGAYCAISVADTGPGIAPEILPRIFEPFFSTKEPGKSAGMGLAAVQGTVKSHSGAVEVRTALGEGATFTLHIPVLAESGIAEALPAATVASGAAEPSDQKIRGLSAADLAGKRAMIVDDERIVLETGTRFLESVGMSVAAFADPGEALSWFSVNEAGVAVVIIDIVMPGIGGTGLFRGLRERSPEKPVIIVSGYSSDGEAESLLKEDRTYFVQKPFERAAFLVAVRKAAGG